MNVYKLEGLDKILVRLMKKELLKPMVIKIWSDDLVAANWGHFTLHIKATFTVYGAGGNLLNERYQLSVSIIITAALWFDAIFLLPLSLLHCSSCFYCISFIFILILHLLMFMEIIPNMINSCLENSGLQTTAWYQKSWFK